MYLPETCTRLDRQAYQASNISELVLATSQLSLGKKSEAQALFNEETLDLGIEIKGFTVSTEGMEKVMDQNLWFK